MTNLPDKWSDLRTKAEAVTRAEFNLIVVYRDLGKALIAVAPELESERAMLASDKVHGLGLSRTSLRRAFKVDHAWSTLGPKVDAGEITSIRQAMAALEPLAPKPQPLPAPTPERLTAQAPTKEDGDTVQQFFNRMADDEEKGMFDFVNGMKDFILADPTLKGLDESEDLAVSILQDVASIAKKLAAVSAARAELVKADKDKLSIAVEELRRSKK